MSASATINAPGACCELEPAGLLHNMSCRPTTAVQREGRHRCRGFQLSTAALAEHGIVSGDFSSLCRFLGVEVGDGQTAERAITQFLNATVERSRLPRVAAVLRNAAADETSFPGFSEITRTIAQRRLRRKEAKDVALAVAVAAKSSRGVFVRDKTPILSEIWTTDVLLVLLPETQGNAAREAKEDL